MRLFALLLSFAFIGLQAQDGKKDYIFEQISSDAGFAYNGISSIVEDDQGFIWFGTDNGLFYYNGGEIIKYNFDPKNVNSLPSIKIKKLYKDKNSRLWVCTNNGICWFDASKNSFTRLDLRGKNIYLSQPKVSSVLQYNDTMYLIVINQEIYYFDKNDEVLSKVSLGDENTKVNAIIQNKNGDIFLGTADGKVYINNGSISDFRSFYESESSLILTLSFFDNQLWIGFDGNGIEVVSRAGKLEGAYKKEYGSDKHIANNRVRSIIKRNNGEIWIGTYDGISIFNSKGNSIIRHNSFNGLPHSSVYEFCIDTNDGIWIGTWSGGLTYFSEYNYRFPHIKISKDNEYNSKNAISSFSEDTDGKIWIGSERSSINKFDPEKQQFDKNKTERANKSISPIKSLTSDHKNRTWIGTFYEGLWVIEKNQFSLVGKITDILHSLLAVDNGIWIGTRNSGLFFYNTNSKTFKQFLAEDKKMGSISSNHVWDVFLDSKENLWICSDFGLSVKYKNNTDFERFFNNKNENSLSRNFCYSVAQDNDGNIWIGTAGGGIDIYDSQTKTFGKFRQNASIEYSDVYSILKDHQNNMWFSTNQGIYVYYPKTNILQSFTEQDGLLGNQYLPLSGFISSSGKLFFGGPNGFNMIDPSTITKNPIVPEAYLSKFLINNQPLSKQKPKYINSLHLAQTDDIQLNYKQNSLTIGFTATNFIKTARNKFKYRIKNYLDDWVEINQGTDVSFTKIPPGKYVLEVLASNNDGLWSEKPKKINIKIYPPYWLSWYAYLLYVILMSSIFIVVIRELRFRTKSKTEEKLFQEKVKFFTNVSHEFRTPLALILSPLNYLKKKMQYEPSLLEHINIIKRNAERLLRLTNQILDFRLIELKKIELKREKEDIVNLCKNVYECFEYQITEKNINCIFTSSFKSLELAIDVEKMEKVIYNLLSNALKYSPDNAQVILSIDQRLLQEKSYSRTHYVGNKFFGDALVIKVKDNGKGISKDSLPLIFDRFFVDHDRAVAGTGIGLHICQEYTRLHGGNIFISSKEGKGSVFKVNIPIENMTGFQKEDQVIQYHFDRTNETEKKEQLVSDGVKNGKVVLFAEDNDELRIFFKNLLSTKYRVLTAKNGKQAFEIAKEVVPDIIISDILMPGTDGLELTKMIRNTEKTNHIPLILLTALSNDKYKMDSMAKGANLFLTKPVDEAILFANIENIFKNRETLKKKYKTLENEQPSVSNKNETFIIKAERIVEENFQNPAFEILEFASALGMSRSSLQRKMKAENNLTPTEFIRDFKLNKAVELLKSGGYNIDEIGTLAGFNSTSYFIRSFKKKYGKTPLSFRN